MSVGTELRAHRAAAAHRVARAMSWVACLALVVPTAVSGQEPTGHDFHPRFSPDGGMIAFYTMRYGLADVMVMNSDGTALRNVTASPDRWDVEPHWTPDGRALVFGSGADMPSLRPHRIELDGTGYRLLSSSLSPAAIFNAWFPDGQRMVVSGRSGVRDLRVVDAAGTVEVVVTEPDTSRSAGSAAVSPDGSRLAYVVGRAGEGDIWILDLGTRSRRRLTSTGVDASPAWSPDGRKLAFVSARDGGHEIYVMDVDGGPVRRLTRTPDRVFWPDWSPDGGRIAFSAKIGGADVDIWIMNADGTGRRNLTGVTR